MKKKQEDPPPHVIDVVLTIAIVAITICLTAALCTRILGI